MHALIKMLELYTHSQLINLILLMNVNESYFDNKSSSLFLLYPLKLSHILVFSHMFLDVPFDHLLHVRWFCRRPVCDPSNINTSVYSSNVIVCRNNDDTSFCDLCCLQIDATEISLGSKNNFPVRLSRTDDKFSKPWVDLDFGHFCILLIDKVI